MLDAGLTYLEKGQRAKAEELFEKALKASPKDYKIPLQNWSRLLEKRRGPEQGGRHELWPGLFMEEREIHRDLTSTASPHPLIAHPYF